MKSVLAFGTAGSVAAQSVMGVRLKDVDKQVEVREVFDGLPARLAGVQPYDIITRLKEAPVASLADVLAVLKKTPPDTDIAVTIERKGKTVRTTLTTIAPSPTTPSAAARDAIDEVRDVGDSIDAVY